MIVVASYTRAHAYLTYSDLDKIFLAIFIPYSRHILEPSSLLLPETLMIPGPSVSYGADQMLVQAF